MDWRLKVVGHWFTSALPPLLYPMQRYVTRSLPRGDEEFNRYAAFARRHFDLATEARGRTPRNAYEFGAGWDLLGALAMSQWVPEQTVTDIERHVRPELVADLAARLDVEPDLAARGIDYRAPIDTAATGLPSGAFDLVLSTAVLEHVSPDRLGPLLAECRRLMAPDGVFTALVDYSDHYSQGDPNLDPDNFLRYGERSWRFLNPPSHYQSRVRHPEMLERIRAARLTPVCIETIDGEHGPLSAWIVARTPAP